MYNRAQQSNIEMDDKDCVMHLSLKTYFTDISVLFNLYPGDLFAIFMVTFTFFVARTTILSSRTNIVSKNHGGLVQFGFIKCIDSL